MARQMSAVKKDADTDGGQRQLTTPTLSADINTAYRHKQVTNDYTRQRQI